MCICKLLYVEKRKGRILIPIYLQDLTYLFVSMYAAFLPVFRKAAYLPTYLPT